MFGGRILFDPPASAFHTSEQQVHVTVPSLTNHFQSCSYLYPNRVLIFI